MSSKFFLFCVTASEGLQHPKVANTFFSTWLCDLIGVVIFKPNWLLKLHSHCIYMNYWAHLAIKITSFVKTRKKLPLWPTRRHSSFYFLTLCPFVYIQLLSHWFLTFTLPAVTVRLFVCSFWVTAQWGFLSYAPHHFLR